MKTAKEIREAQSKIVTESTEKEMLAIELEIQKHIDSGQTRTSIDYYDKVSASAKAQLEMLGYSVKTTYGQYSSHNEESDTIFWDKKDGVIESAIKHVSIIEAKNIIKSWESKDLCTHLLEVISKHTKGAESISFGVDIYDDHWRLAEFKVTLQDKNVADLDDEQLFCSSNYDLDDLNNLDSPMTIKELQEISTMKKPIFYAS
jgi:hypothetical protein